MALDDAEAKAKATGQRGCEVMHEAGRLLRHAVAVDALQARGCARFCFKRAGVLAMDILDA